MSRIEQLIGEIEEYIDSCKFQTLSNSKIIVNKEEMEELLVELRLRVPEEIKKYQKIISQQDAILADAKGQAETMSSDAKSRSEELVSDNEIMQQAYAKANELIRDAQNQADSIVNNAVADADQIRSNAIRYTDEMLASLETIISRSLDNATRHLDELKSSLNDSRSIVESNREALSKAMPETPGATAEAEGQEQ